jgi:membrane-bound metal-dependent hydrolase YbcI (DUF457 family)
VFTLIHAFANYFLATPIRKRIDVAALLIASALPDLEGLYYLLTTYMAYGVNAAALPSHYFLHSFLGAILIIAPFTVGAVWTLKKYGIIKKADYKLAYLSALLGGLLHIIADVTYHTGADALQLLWPLQTQFSFAFSGSEILWNALGVLGIIAFIYFERKNIMRIIK